MRMREKLFGIDQEITVARRSAVTTIRKEHQKGKVALRKDTLGWVADIEQDDGTSVTFGISESDCKALQRS
jgi:hypothetical protein